MDGVWGGDPEKAVLEQVNNCCTISVDRQLRKILIIEDCKVSQKHLSQILEKTYEVEFQKDGFAGIAAAAKNSPDLILLDVQLASIDGNQVCRLLKNNDVTKDIPVLFITSMGSAQDRVEKDRFRRETTCTSCA